jgi:hypothetical protein
VSLRKAAAKKGISVKVRNGALGQLQVFRDGIKVFDYKESGSLPTTDVLLRMIDLSICPEMDLVPRNSCPLPVFRPLETELTLRLVLPKEPGATTD